MFYLTISASFLVVAPLADFAFPAGLTQPRRRSTGSLSAVGRGDEGVSEPAKREIVHSRWIAATSNFVQDVGGHPTGAFPNFIGFVLIEVTTSSVTSAFREPPPSHHCFSSAAPRSMPFRLLSL
jgi:hypothetical protein